VRGCVLKAYYGPSRSTTGVYVGENEVIALFMRGPRRGRSAIA